MKSLIESLLIRVVTAVVADVVAVAVVDVGVVVVVVVSTSSRAIWPYCQ